MKSYLSSQFQSINGLSRSSMKKCYPKKPQFSSYCSPTQSAVLDHQDLKIERSEEGNLRLTKVLDKGKYSENFRGNYSLKNSSSYSTQSGSSSSNFSGMSWSNIQNYENSVENQNDYVIQNIPKTQMSSSILSQVCESRQRQQQKKKEHLKIYLNHLSKDFQNDQSSKRMFKQGHNEQKLENKKMFMKTLQMNLGEQKEKQENVLIPRLKAYAKIISNCTILKNSFDKKYIKNKKIETKKKKLLEDAKQIDPVYLNYEVTLNNFCSNMQQFLLNHSRQAKATTLQKIHGFNDKIKMLVFDEITHQIRSDFSPSFIHFILTYLTTLENKQKVAGLTGTIPPQIQQAAILSSFQGPKRRQAQTEEVSVNLIKCLFYFNKSLEEHNNQKITEDKTIEIMNSKKEADIVENKLYSAMLKNRVNQVDKQGVFSELKRGLVYSSGNPAYASSIKISDSLKQSEKLSGKFDHILHRNKYQSDCIDKICDYLKQI